MVYIWQNTGKGTQAKIFWFSKDIDVPEAGKYACKYDATCYMIDA
jgi:hypothetical protein